MTNKKNVPTEYWQRVSGFEKLVKRKVCLAAGHGDCDGPVIQAHTIPRSQLLKIAEEGHVQAFQYEGGAFGRNDGELRAGRRGVGQFSVLNCFCQEHDKKLFAPIEDKELIFDGEQLALLHYRAIAAEFYKKEGAVKTTELLVDEFDKKRGPNIVEKQAFLQAMLHGQHLGLRDIGFSFARASEIVSTGSHHQLRSLIVKFNRLPSIMTVGAFAPEFDYDGEYIQTLGDEDSIVDQVSFSLLSSGGKAWFAYVWAADTLAGERMAASLAKQRPERLTSLLIQTAFEYIENTCMNISWWDALKPVERRVLTDRMMQSANPTLPRSARGLGFGGVSFDDWGYEMHTLAPSPLGKELS